MAEKRQLIDANLVTEFGGIEDMAEFNKEGVAHHDYTYVPGFSEMRVKRDLALRELALNNIRAKDVPTLEWNCRWFRTVKGAGSEPDQMRIARAINLGYRVVTSEDVGQPWLTKIPPGCGRRSRPRSRSAGWSCRKMGSGP
jgi:hypothetical protein